MVAKYRGFSSYEFERIKQFSITDIELVKLDLLNHIYTRKGSRVMLPLFGTVIPDLVFEPLDETTLEILEDELRDVFEYDPRVTLIKLNIKPNFDSNAINATAELFFVEFNIVDGFELNIEFEQ